MHNKIYKRKLVMALVTGECKSPENQKKLKRLRQKRVLPSDENSSG